MGEVIDADKEWNAIAGSIPNAGTYALQHALTAGYALRLLKEKHKAHSHSIMLVQSRLVMNFI